MKSPESYNPLEILSFFNRKTLAVLGAIALAAGCGNRPSDELAIKEALRVDAALTESLSTGSYNNVLPGVFVFPSSTKMYETPANTDSVRTIPSREENIVIQRPIVINNKNSVPSKWLAAYVAKIRPRQDDVHYPIEDQQRVYIPISVETTDAMQYYISDDQSPASICPRVQTIEGLFEAKVIRTFGGLHTSFDGERKKVANALELSQKETNKYLQTIGSTNQVAQICKS